MYHGFELTLKKHFPSIIITVDIIHNDEDLCVRCHHREVLYAVKDYFENKEVYFNYRENLLGKILVISRANYKDVSIVKDELYLHYKKHYVNRINKIIDLCTDDQLRQEYYQMINAPFDMAHYLSIRDKMNHYL